jgi:hypothetical protein
MSENVKAGMFQDQEAKVERKKEPQKLRINSFQKVNINKGRRVGIK